MADLPIALDPSLRERLLAALDVEGKILRALDALGPVAGRDLALVGGGPVRADQLTAAGAHVEAVERDEDGRLPLGDASVDAVVGWWSGFHGGQPAEVVEADRVLRPAGRLLVVHDYGRDDVSRLRGEQPEYGTWSRRDGPYLRGGFRIRVVHCWWTFPDLDDARDFLAAAFGEAGIVVGEGLTRPRLSYNVAVYHRTRADEPARDDRAAATAAGR